MYTCIHAQYVDTCTCAVVYAFRHASSYPRFSLSQLSVPMQTPGLNSMSISIPTPTLPYSTSYGGMQEARTESGIATNRTAVEDFWAQGSTHLGHQPDSGTPRAQSSHSLQLYTSDGRTKHSVHPSHLPSPRPPLSSQVEQHTSQMEQMEQRRECAHLGYVRSTAGATVTSAGLEATLLPLFLPRVENFCNPFRLKLQ